MPGWPGQVVIRGESRLIWTIRLFIGVAIVAVSAGCRSLPSDTGEAMTFHFDFDEGSLGFVAGFADYPPAHEEIYELVSGHRPLPPPLESQSGLFISGVNRSDDLFMFFKGPIAGLTPRASYAIESVWRSRPARRPVASVSGALRVRASGSRPA